MKCKYILTIIVLLIFNGKLSYSQNHLNKSVKKLYNSMATDYFITLPVEVFNDSGKLIGKRSLIQIENKYVKKIVGMYGERLVPYLIDNLNDPKRDFVCNLILYQITKKEAIVFKFYKKDMINQWRTIRKANDLLYWKKFPLLALACSRCLKVICITGQQGKF